MAIDVVALHHHGIRIEPTEDGAEKALGFYRDVLGLDADPGRTVVGVPGYWINVGGERHQTQIHLIGMTGSSKQAPSPEKDPTLPQVALSVRDIDATKKELDRLGVDYWGTGGVTGQYSEQVFVLDPAGNIIELHQEGTCRCRVA